MISICMAAYNGESYIKEQIISIIEQMSKDDELIIVNDNSNDNTLNEIESIGDPRINVTTNRKNLGVINSFEKAIKLSKGEIIFLADQDDVWMPEKIQRMVDVLLDNSIKLVVSDAYILDNSEILLNTFYKFKNSGRGILKNIIRNSYIGCCIAFKAEILPYILPFPKHIPMHDIWIGLVAEAVGRSTFIPDRLILYRRHGNNITSMQKSSLKVMTKNRTYIIISLMSNRKIMRRIILGRKL